MAVGFSLANINMILSTMVLIASLIWTLMQIKDKFKMSKIDIRAKEMAI